MSSQSEKFWVEEPCVLFKDLSFFPVKNMTQQEKLNALTRLAIIISVIMYFMKYEHWFVFLTLSILSIIVINYSGDFENYKKGESSDVDSVESSTDIESTDNDDTGEDNKTLIENFSVTPTYTGSDFQQTIVAPTFAEEWQINPPEYDLYTQVSCPEDFMEEPRPPLSQQSYPYGQYLTRTNLLPSDEYYTHQGCGGSKSAREYVNNAFLRHSLAGRENISRIHKKRLSRQFRHNNLHDSYSPFVSY